MASEYNTFTIEKRGAVDWLTLNRPESRNAITLEMATELRDYYGGLSEDASVRIVVMRGAGKSFCAGLDIKEAGDVSGSDGPFGGGMGFQSYLAEAYLRMRKCPQPIISLVQGAACGGGFSFVLASDIRIAGESARMNAAYIKIGLSACDMGCSYFLPRLVGTSVASELMLTGRFIEAPRALATGLVSAVVPDAGPGGSLLGCLHGSRGTGGTWHGTGSQSQRQDLRGHQEAYRLASQDRTCRSRW